MRVVLKHFIAVALFLLGSLACAGVGELPSAPTPTAAPPPPAVPAKPPKAPGLTPPGNLQSAAVARVIDGDTIELVDGRRVRYIGINTPERDQPYYKEATDSNRQLVAGKQIQLEFDVDTFDQYGRTLAYVWVDGLLANLEIVRRGFANVYTVPPNVRYEANFRAAEQDARKASRGLWAGAGLPLKILQIHANAPGNDNENPNGEWIEIANQGASPVSMRGFTLKDEANHIYKFGDFTLPPGVQFKLFSGVGRDTSTKLYWGLVNDSVWNNNSDTAFLRDATGALVDSYTY